jgi:hypothetical protein
MSGTHGRLNRRELLSVATAAVQASMAAPAAAALAAPTPEQAFVTPPQLAGPWVYWMWLDGNVTPESVATDLRAMHDVGIAGAYVLDVLQGTPPGPARYMDATWQTTFRHAVETARGLGMQLIFNNGAGYYGSGGPWITPELSMQILVQSETPVVGGRRIGVELPRPKVPSDEPPVTPWYANEPLTKTFGVAGADYRDIAVIAVREPATARMTMADGRPALTVDGRAGAPLPTSAAPLALRGGTTLMIHFAAAWHVRAAEIVMKDVKGGLRLTIAIEEGGGWRDLGAFAFSQETATQSLSLPAASGRTYRISVAGGADAAARLAAVDLHARTRVADPTGMKLLTWYEWNGYTGAGSAPLDALLSDDAAAIALDDVIDVSSYVRDGRLTWDAPPGEWTVLRIGHGGKGRIIGPVRADGAGLESDKLSLAATELHFNAMVRKLMAATGPAARSTVLATHIDSWEGGGQNWTPGMREEFTRRRGYDPLPWLPIVSGGRVLGDLQTTERFLWDLRRTVSELSKENYWAPMKRLSNGIGLALSAESYTTIGNDLDASDVVDEPMAEFWKHTGDGFNGFGNTCKAMASAAHLNGRAIVSAEAFTSIDTEKWQDHPGTLKALGDRNLAKGINRFVFHRYSAQRFPDIGPGLQMGPWGLHYERTQTWWTMSRPWHIYLARCQHMLRQGRAVADMLRVPSEEPLLRVEDRPVAGYDYDHVGPDMLATAQMEGASVVFASGAAYRLIVLDHQGTMTLATLQKLAALVRGGAGLLGEPPQATPGLTDRIASDRKVRALADELWGGLTKGEHTYGRGRVFRALSPQDALARMGVLPDFESDVPLSWLHRRDADRDIWFIASQALVPTLANLTLRHPPGRCELYDPEAGTITPWHFTGSADDGRMRVSVPLAAEGSMFVVLRRGAADPVMSVDRDGTALFRNGRAERALLPLLRPTPSVAIPGRYTLRRRASARSVTVSPVAAPHTLSRPWQLRFPANLGAPPTAEMTRLHSLSEHPDRGIAHFSGIASYRTSFATARTIAGQRMWLDLGQVEVAARLRLNGHDLGILWRAPYAIDITDALTTGDNLLEVQVATRWINRLIGDENLPPDTERFGAGPGLAGRNSGSLKTWPQWLLDGQPSPTGRVSFSTWNLYRKGDPLVPSGLIGPVRLIVSTEALEV